MKAIEILKKLRWSDILPDLVKIWDGGMLYLNLSNDQSFLHLIDGNVKGNAWYCVVRSCLVDAIFEYDEPEIAAHVEYMGYEYVCVEIDE